MEKMRKGPIMVAARRQGFSSFSRASVIQLLSLMAAAFLLTWLLLQTSGLGYARRVTFLATTGRGECYRRSSQLELVGILWHVHSSEPCRLHDHVAARGPSYRESCKAEDKFRPLSLVKTSIRMKLAPCNIVTLSPSSSQVGRDGDGCVW